MGHFDFLLELPVTSWLVGLKLVLWYNHSKAFTLP